MNTKYDWSDVPSEVQWIATDNDGVANGFTEKPIIGESGLWVLADMDYEKVVPLISLLDHFNKALWQDSLEQRPCP